MSVQDIDEDAKLSRARFAVVDVAEALLAQLPGAVDGWRLQKLCYLVQGKHLAQKGNSAFREPIEAWAHGPVIDALYLAHKRLRFVDTVHGDARLVQTDETVDGLVHQVVKQFGDWSGHQLRELTRSQYPWIEARYGLGPTDSSRPTISRDTMREYFKLIDQLPDDDLEDGGTGSEGWTSVLRF